MADRTVTVRLRAVINDYQAAMGKARKSTDDVAKSADRWRQLGRSTAELGDSLTRNITLPLVAVGAAATKAALDFDKVFQEMHQLAGVSAGEIGNLKESVLDLAGETGKAPQELAEALYFLRSSGLEGAEAMDALEMSAKASAAGLGSTAQIADAVSSAMNAYAASGLSAAEATDVLVATAEAGKAEPAELAQQMGRLLPISSELGISFQDVGAGLAALSLSGNDAAAATTLMQNLMSKLLRPSQQAQERLAAVGISLDDIRSMIAERGLLGTLETLKESLGDAGFVAFLEDVQAVQAGLSLTGQNVEEVRGIFDELNNSAGRTEAAFEKWAETMGAQNARAFAELQAALIRIGDVIAPIAADVLGFVGDVLNAFSQLPKGAQQAIIAFAAIAAAIGPIISAGGRVIQAISAISKAVSSSVDFAGRFISGFRNADAAASAFSGTAGTLGGKLRGLSVAAGVATAIAGIAAAIEAANDAAVRREIDELTTRFLATGDASERLEDALNGDLRAMAAVDGMFDDLVESNLAAAERFMEQAEAAGFSAEQIDWMRQKIEEKRAADQQAVADQEANTAAVEEGAEAYDEQAAAVNRAVEALNAQADALAAQFDPLFGLISANQGVRDALVTRAEAEAAVAEAAREHGRNSAEYAEAQRQLNDAIYGTAQAAVGQEQALINLAAAVENGDVTIDEARAALQRWSEQGLISAEDVDFLRLRFESLINTSEDYADTPYIATVGERGARMTAGELNIVRDAANQIPSSRNTDVTERGSRRTAGELNIVRDRAHAIPDRRNTNVSERGSRRTRDELDRVTNSANRIPSRRNVTITSRTGDAINNIDAVTSAVNRVPKSVTVSIAFRSYGQAELNRARALTNREKGGPVKAGRAYVVGERQPELFIPDEDGMILPEVPRFGRLHDVDMLQSMRPASTEVGSVYAPTITVSLAGAVVGSEAEAARWLSRALRKAGQDKVPLTIRGRSL
jgi:TP901 family phage tail tape measure protein